MFVITKSAALGAAASLAGLLAAPPASAAPPSVRIDQAWIRTPPPGAPTAAAYARLTNTSSKTDRLIAASAPDAESVSAHTMTMSGGVMRMRPAQGGLELPPGQTRILAPGVGAHLMIIHPKRPLRPGAKMAVTLRFARAGRRTALFTVSDAPPPEKR